MLPTTGYFKNLICPFYESCMCERPYCHYRHHKQDSQQDANVISELVSKAVHKVLSSTQGKSTDKDTETKPVTYNPTPISTLNKYKSNTGHVEKRVKRNHIPYSPQQPAKCARIEEMQLQYDVGDYVNTSVGYSPTPKSSSVKYVPSTIESLYLNNSDSDKNGSDQSYEPVKLYSTDNYNLDVKYNPTNNDQLTLNEDTTNNYVPNYNDDFIDNFLSDPNIYEPTEISPAKSDKSAQKPTKSEHRVTKSDKSSKSSVKHSKSDEKRSKYDSKSSSSKTVKCSKSEDKTSKDSVKSTKSDTKHHEKDSKSETTAKKDTKNDKTNDSKSDKHHQSTTNKDSKNGKSHDSKTDKTHDSKTAKHLETSKNGSKSDKSSETTTKTDSKSDKNLEKGKSESKSDKSRRNSSSHSKDRSRSKSEKITANKRSTEHRKKEDSKHSSSTSKQNGKSSHEPEQNGKSSSSSSHRSSKERDKSKHRSSSSSKDKLKPVPEPEMDPNSDIFADVFFDDEDVTNGEIDKNTLEQCKKIFDEYEAAPVAEAPPKVAQPPVKEEEAQSTLSRKRTAHEGSSNVIRPKVSKPNKISTPGMVMAARYKLILANVKDTQNMNTVSAITSEPGTSKDTQPNLYKTTTMNLRKPVQHPVEAIQPSGRSSRIAHVPNVSSLINAKKKISEVKKTSEPTKTTMHTVAKGSKRIAHTSELCLNDVPTVLQSEKSKLPINMRNKFLKMMLTECMKIYQDQETSNQRALNEELNCYLKCSVLTTYRNSCLLSVNRLRKESEGIGSGDAAPSTDELEFVGIRFYENLYRWILTEEELVDNGYPRYPAPKKGFAVIKITKPVERVREGSELCVRCKKQFLVKDNGYPTFPEDCLYHPSSRFVVRGEARYMCCRETASSVGCCVCSTHVYETRDPNLLSGFVRTFDPEDPDDPKSTQIFALDCEMVYSTRGFELARVTIVTPAHEVVYDSLVKPLGQILDANTRFSGLTIEMLETVSTRITDVQAALLLLFNSKTILVGHSLESDLKALRLIHSTVIDTAVLFPHKMGPPKKRGLRTLASDFLKKIIQNSESGHDSAEDAITCMELVVWRLKEELKTR